MRKFLVLILSLVMAKTGFVQINFNYLQTDSLRHELSTAKQDTSRVMLMSGLAEAYRWSNSDSAMYYGQKALALASKINFKRGEANALLSLSVVQRELGNLAMGLDFATKALSIAQGQFSGEEITALLRIANVYSASTDYNKALMYLHQAEAKSQRTGNNLYLNISQWLIALALEQKNELDSALYYADRAFRNSSWDAGTGYAYNILGDIQLKLKNDSLALHNYWLGLMHAARIKDYRTAANLNISLANYYKNHSQLDSAIYYGKEGLAVAQLLSYKNRIISSSSILAEIYEAKDPKEALRYYKIFNSAKDSLYGADKMQALQTLMIDEQEKKKEAEAAQLAYQNRIKQYGLLGGLLFVFIILLLLYRNNRRKQKANELLEKQKREIEKQRAKAEIETALEKVRATAMSMRRPGDMLEVCKVISQQLDSLGTKEIRNVQTAIFYEEKGTYTNYEFYARHDKLLITEVDYKLHPAQYEFAYKMLQGPDEFFTLSLEEQKLKDWYDYQKTTTQFADSFLETASSLNYYWYSMGPVALGLSTYVPLSADQIALFKRFRNVFELSYRRYLDIEKAEAQAREAQIEAGLERVRGRAMGMQSSEELNTLIGTVFSELTKLDLVLTRCVIWVFDPATDAARWWMANSEEPSHPMSFLIKYHEHPAYLKFLKEWKNQNVKFVYDLKGQDKIGWDRILFNDTELKNLPEAIKNGMAAPERVILSASFNNFGGINVASLEPLSEEHFDILLRFAKVFDLTYTRFLDLQKAEAQARESQIQLALERVRARTMAMQKSDELSETAVLLFRQLMSLELNVRGCGINIWEKDEKICTSWMSGPDGMLSQPFHLPLTDDPLFIRYYESRQKGEDFWVYETGKDELKKRYDYLSTLPVLGDAITKGLGAGKEIPSFVVDHVVNFSNGNLLFITYEHCPEAHDIFKRFGKVFQQTYTRFLDLQKAEAQAREAEIEASLERVRSKTMAMHNSQDVSVASAVMFNEFSKLGIHTMRCGIGVLHNDSDMMEVWAATIGKDGHEMKGAGQVSMKGHSLWQQMYADWKEKKESFLYHLQGDDLKAYYRALSNTSSYSAPYLKENFEDHYCYVTYFEDGAIFTFNYNLYTVEQKQVLKRFAAVFSLTYKRYKDLRRAEAQAREATIEAALEKVRGKAMAMHNSNDLSATASIVFTELRKLGINPVRCGVGLLTNESRKALLYSAGSSPDGDSLSLMGWVMLSGHPVLEDIYHSWQKGEDCFPELQGEQLRSYYEILLKGLSVKIPEGQMEQVQYGHFLTLSVGCLYVWSDVKYNADEVKILKRFAAIIELTFRRYLELQQSEANAKEAVMQATLDRIRADIASMRTVSDLDRITPLIWNELTTLSVPFIRCGVFIMDATERLIHTFLSTPDGRAIAAFHIPYDAPGNIEQVLRHWNEKSTYISQWKEVDFTGIAEILVEQGAIAKKEQYLDTLPKDGFYLHFLPFLQGMLYVGNTNKLSEDQIELLQHVADAFSTAYARYEDFNKLEAAKKQVDSMLIELKSTQQQLIHSEKMASLGELTAGIAHEIQNPLNFVNNFSELSVELIEDIKSELNKGDIQEANVMVNDVKQNLEKIAHHGKRADAIVKSMLQHSRKSSGQKDFVDINALVDEYLRMSYHGFRAKVKSFNAILETHFDPEVKKANIMGQDIGRVLINLFNNAFYAVNEKKKRDQNGFEPIIQVTTSNLNNHIEIKIKDNGTGIPEKVLEKIYQPFFTTKPTGEGTGLGLSLSYDIITKGHGGELKVDSKDGEGSEFIIQLPLQPSR